MKWAPANPAPTSAKAYPIGGFTMMLLYTCYASQDVVDGLAAPFGAGDPGYMAWLFGTAVQNGDVPNFVLAQKGLGSVPSAWEKAAYKLLFTESRSKIRKAPDTTFPAASQVCPVGTGA